METTLFTQCIFEFLGTLILILLGNGVVACTTLKKSKGEGGGWIVITMGWGFAVMCGVFVSGPYSGALLNPAVTLAQALAGNMSWIAVPGYIAAQLTGAMAGAGLVYLMYMDHFKATEQGDTKLGCFATMPAIMNRPVNLLSEIIGTWLLILCILAFATSANTASVQLGANGAFPVTMLIMAIGMSLGGTTGYAINPARDLGPRIMHALIPMQSKRDSGWSYSWVPVLGPVLGACLAVLTARVIF